MDIEINAIVLEIIQNWLEDLGYARNAYFRMRPSGNRLAIITPDNMNVLMFHRPFWRWASHILN